MSENSWVLRGVDAETRELAIAEAERRGVSVSDFLTEVLLGGGGVAQPPAERESEPDWGVSPPGRRENFAFRHRLEALERRLGLTTGGLEAAVHALDNSLLALSARFDQTEALADDTAETLHQALSELTGNVAAFRKRLTDLETSADGFNESQEAARGERNARDSALEAQLERLDAIARGAEAKASSLAARHDALQRALAQDFADFADEAGSRIEDGVNTARVIADAAARHADEAVARALSALRESRETFEQSLHAQAEETRARMHAAFGDAAERLGALTERVIEGERNTAHVSEQVNARISDVEDGLHTTIEDTAARLRSVDAALAADLVRVSTEGHAALETLAAQLRGADQELAARFARTAEHHRETAEDFKASLTQLTERQLASLARIKLIDSSLADALTQVNAMGVHLEQRISEAREGMRGDFSTTQSGWDARFGALAARANEHERQIAEGFHGLDAEVARIESCTVAALEKLAGDIAEVSGQTSGALARLRLVDQALGEGAGEISTPLLTRIAQIESAVRAAETPQALEALRIQLDTLANQVAAQACSFAPAVAVSALQSQVQQLAAEASAYAPAAVVSALQGQIQQFAAETSTFASAAAVSVLQEQIERLAADADLYATASALASLQQRLDALVSERGDDADLRQKVEELRARVAAQEGHAAESADRVHGVARMLGRLTAQNADAATQSESRLHKLELAVANARLTGAPQDAGATQAAIEDIAARIIEIEQRQTDAFETLRADIGAFITDNERRLSQLEQGGIATLTGDEVLIARAIETRLTELEQRDVAVDFERLRQRIEERVLGVETRSVRALEQIGETVAMLERRFVADGAAEKASLSA